jgi:PleD family two-component response regulator
MTITLGLTLVQTGEFLDDVVARADRALYVGKHSGRDRCVMLNG